MHLFRHYDCRSIKQLRTQATYINPSTDRPYSGSQVTAAKARRRYSAFKDERDTILCFFLLAIIFKWLKPYFESPVLNYYPLSMYEPIKQLDSSTSPHAFLNTEYQRGIQVKHPGRQWRSPSSRVLQIANEITDIQQNTD